MSSELDALVVKCQRSNCIWSGELKDWRTHGCPSAHYNTLALPQLHQLMLEDERIAVKVHAMEQMRLIIIREEEEVALLDYLSLVFYYIRLFHVYEEIVEPGLMAMSYVCKRPGGVGIVDKAIPEIWKFVRNYCCRGTLRSIGMDLLKVHDALESLQILFTAAEHDDSSKNV